MAVKAYILINTETNLTQSVAEMIRGMTGTTEVNEVLGPFDLVVELEAVRLEDVTSILRDKIRPISGVRDTVTCVTMR